VGGVYIAGARDRRADKRSSSAYDQQDETAEQGNERAHDDVQNGNDS
jgi:hypothetical protein